MDLTQFKAFAAERFECAADQLQGLLDNWPQDGDATGAHWDSPDALTGGEYPFSMSLDEQIAEMRGAIETLHEAVPKPFTCPRCDVAYTDLCTPIMCARLDSDGEDRRPEMTRFIDLNPATMKGFTQEMADQAEGYAEHHAGGLHVLGKRTATGYLKMHDTWGDDGPVIVHHYDPDFDGLGDGTEGPDADPVEWAANFDNGREALLLFLTIEEV